MESTVRDIAALVDGEVRGDGGTLIRGVNGMREAKHGDITFLANPRYVPLAGRTRASAIVVADGIALETDSALISVKNPDLAFIRIVEHFNGRSRPFPTGVHPTAVVDASAKIGRDVAVGAHCVVEEDVQIGDGTVLMSQVFVGRGAKLGKNCRFHPMVVVAADSEIGSNVILNSGVVIGSDGFGYVTVEGRHIKIPQIGTVLLEDDVEIGAGSTVDRARFDRAGRGAAQTH